ncbi:hypothetical protein RRF57_005030 [Xylaria bambusicola]|uniref:Uncharacterized protein n=1 Tax=Xylaria bambusicola TaxID=326684 RepID=A0AAN7Z920_9PEZI
MAGASVISGRWKVASGTTASVARAGFPSKAKARVAVTNVATVKNLDMVSLTLFDSSYGSILILQIE